MFCSGQRVFGRSQLIDHQRPNAKAKGASGTSVAVAISLAHEVFDRLYAASVAGTLDRPNRYVAWHKKRQAVSPKQP